MPLRAVSFDAGQTLVELDTAMLSARLAERGAIVSQHAIDAGLPAAWRRHEEAVAAGTRHPWHDFMRALLDAAGVGAGAAALVDWLFSEQPRRNLFRRDVPGMRALVDELAAELPLVVVSNSEGKLVELLTELGWAHRFVAIADSTVLGVAKPDPAIFAWALARLDVPAADVVHVGDSREADVDGALAAGLRAVWFGRGAHLRPDDDPARVAACPDAAALRATLIGWRS